jgi:XTP/dITP diphosphohydrolase
MEAPMRKLLIATRNEGKLKEIKALLEQLPVELVTPGQIGISISVIEDGHTYKENATKKVLAFAEATGLLSLADDSGLEVASLNGEPGVYSARFSGKKKATDADRRTYLLSQLEPYPQPWQAQFRCVVALYDPGGGLHFSEGICSGKIISEERGRQGFGYDPIFQLEGLNRTMAELSMDEKNRLSHRAHAILEIKPEILKILGD